MRICSHIYALVILRTKLLKNFDIAKFSHNYLQFFLFYAQFRHMYIAFSLNSHIFRTISMTN